MRGMTISCVDGYWEVPLDRRMEWVRCNSQQHAQRMSDSGKLVCDVFERKRFGEEVALEFDEAIKLFLQYSSTARATWLNAMRIVLIFVAMGFTTLANGAELTTNFDSLPSNSGSFEIRTGGIRFFGLNVGFPPPPSAQFIIWPWTEDWPHVSAPNYMRFIGNQFTWFSFDFPGDATSASLDLFAADRRPEIGLEEVVLTLTAYHDSAIVGVSTYPANQGTFIAPSVRYYPVSIHAAPFNKLRLSVTTLTGRNQVLYQARVDNVRIQISPEPATWVLGIVAVLLIAHRRR